MTRAAEVYTPPTSVWSDLDEPLLLYDDCLTALPDLGTSTIDAVVTDPPYGLKFMGKDWDHGVPGVPYWRAVLDVLKPGGYLLAFGGTRTYHRLTCAVEDAGFEIRDCLMWVYGSGFPKSLDVGKAIDRQLGKPRSVRGKGEPVDRIALDYGGSTGKAKSGLRSQYAKDQDARTNTATYYNGYGTALKPAYEPILLARKPLEGTVASNVLEYGTGGLNIDACRVGERDRTQYGLATSTRSKKNTYSSPSKTADFDSSKGRWPANLIHDGSDEVTELFPVTSSSAGTAARFFYCAKASRSERDAGLADLPHQSAGVLTNRKDDTAGLNSPRAGAGRSSGGRNTHPTVKPLALMRYLCRLVTPAGGVVLDPFLGSGSTGVAAVAEGFGFIGVELDSDSYEIACRRLGV